MSREPVRFLVAVRKKVLLVRFLVAVRKKSGTTSITDPLYHSLDEDNEGDDGTKTEDNQSLYFKLQFTTSRLSYTPDLLSSAGLSFIIKFNENIFYLSLNSLHVFPSEEPPFSSLSSVSKSHHLCSAAFNGSNTIQAWSCACSSFYTWDIIAKFWTHVPSMKCFPLFRLSVTIFLPVWPITVIGHLSVCCDAFTAFEVFKPLWIMKTRVNSETSQMIMRATGCCTFPLLWTCRLVLEIVIEIGRVSPSDTSMS